MQISFLPTVPSIRKDAAQAAVCDSSIYTIGPRAGPMSPQSDAAALGAGLLRAVPWSEGGQAGRLMRGALADRMGVSRYDAAPALSELASDTDGLRHAMVATSSDGAAELTAPMGHAAACLDMRINAQLFRCDGPTSSQSSLGSALCSSAQDSVQKNVVDDGTHILFLSFDLLFDPAFRTPDPDGSGAGRAVVGFQDLVGLAVAPAEEKGAALQLLPGAVTACGPGSEPCDDRLVSWNASSSAGVTSSVVPDDTQDAACDLLSVNSTAGSTLGDSFDLSVLRGDPSLSRAGPSAAAQMVRRAGLRNGISWLSGLRRAGGLVDPAAYNVCQPGQLAHSTAQGIRLRRLPPEAALGLDQSYSAAFAVNAARLKGDARLNVLAVQRMVSLEIGAAAQIGLATRLFVVACQITLRGGAGAPPGLYVNRRRCWGTDLRRDTDALGDVIRTRAIPGRVWRN